MKSILTISLLLVLLTTSLLSAQNKTHSIQRNKDVSAKTEQANLVDHTILDKLQKETEDISVVRPFLFIAAVIQGRLELRKSEREAVAAARLRETGSR
jgi:hypothetical protein